MTWTDKDLNLRLRKKYKFPRNAMAKMAKTEKMKVINRVEISRLILKR